MFPYLLARLGDLLSASMSSNQTSDSPLKPPRRRIFWPKIRVQWVTQACQGTRITDIALSFTGGKPPLADGDTAPPAFEGTIYLVWKRKH